VSAACPEDLPAPKVVELVTRNCLDQWGRPECGKDCAQHPPKPLRSGAVDFQHELESTPRAWLSTGDRRQPSATMFPRYELVVSSLLAE